MTDDEAEDGPERLSRRLTQLRENLGGAATVSQALAWVAIAGGVTLLVGAFLEPQWLIRLFLDHLPGGLFWLIDLLDIQATTVLGLYGGALTLVAVGVFVAVQRRQWADEDRLAALREHLSLRFLVAVSFVIGFVGARAVVIMGGLAGDSTPSRAAESLPIGEIWLQGYHIHHFFFGFAALVLVGWLALFYPSLDRRWLAILYGLGMGIFVDEIGLLVTWGEYYARSTWFVAALFLSIVVAGMVWTWDQVEESGEESPPPEG